MLERFIDKNFNAKTEAVIDAANAIIAEYQAQGFSLTLRQLYYQFVARDILPNTLQSYKRLGNIVSDARLAGLIDWNAIEDRTRNRQSVSHWRSPASIIELCAQQYRIDKWDDQEHRVEVWIEKEALIGVIERVCRQYDVAWFACRGYVSQSEQYAAGKRFQAYAADGQRPVILHLGDHDPSGIDMTRDNQQRLWTFSYQDVEVRRIALNMDQVDEYGPPPNPAKLTDSRAEGYISRFGYDSWELDALDPKVIEELIQDQLLDLLDMDKFNDSRDIEAGERATLEDLSVNYDRVIKYLEGDDDEIDD